MRITAGRADPGLVRQKLAWYLAECAADGKDPATGTREFYEVMEALVPLGLKSLTPRQQAGARARLREQVLRELNLLAADGKLVKRGSKRDLRFYTPEAARRADAAEAGRRAADAAEAERGRSVWQRLERLGLDPVVRGGWAIQLEGHEWERLVEMAEKGRNG